MRTFEASTLLSGNPPADTPENAERIATIDELLREKIVEASSPPVVWDDLIYPYAPLYYGIGENHVMIEALRIVREVAE